MADVDETVDETRLRAHYLSGFTALKDGGYRVETVTITHALRPTCWHWVSTHLLVMDAFAAELAASVFPFAVVKFSSNVDILKAPQAHALTAVGSRAINLTDVALS